MGRWPAPGFAAGEGDGTEIARVAVARWWRSPKPIPRRTAWANPAVGLACLGLTVGDVRLGLGTYGRWFLGYFGVLSTVWAVLALRLGDRTAVRRLRLGGDVTAWAALAVFSVLGLVVAGGKTGPLLTLVAFAVVTALGAARGIRAEAGAGRTAGPAPDARHRPRR